jgi:Flp pilus assembly protein TadG
MVFQDTQIERRITPRRVFEMNFSSALVKFPLSKQSISSRVATLLSSCDRGSAVVEMAVVLPFMLMMLTGIFSFSTALYQKLLLAEALSSGGRVLAADRGDTDPCLKATQAIYSASPGLNKNNITLTYTINGVSYGTGTTSCPGPTGLANQDMTAGGNAQVQASYPCSLSVYGVSYASCSLGTQITENVQ